MNTTGIQLEQDIENALRSAQVAPSPGAAATSRENFRPAGVGKQPSRPDELQDYYARLDTLDAETDAYWAARP